MKHTCMASCVCPKRFMYLRSGKEDTNGTEDETPHAFALSILRWGIGGTKATMDCKFVAKIMQMVTKELTTVIGVPSNGLRGIIREIGFKVIEEGL